MTAVYCGDMCSPDFGADELGRAARICYSHVARSAVTTIPSPRIPRFQQGWEACEKVYAAWLEGEQARMIREREAEDERQRAYINDFAARLK